MNISISLTPETIPIIETLEILQNYKSIEDINNTALAAYMKDFARHYADEATVYVLKNRKYKKSTIAFLESFLNYFKVENTLNQFLSSLSSYAIPDIENSINLYFNVDCFEIQTTNKHINFLSYSH